MTVKINAILVIAATIAAVGSVSAATTINPRYANMAALTLKQEATRLFAENDVLKAGGGGAGPVVPGDFGVLATCVETGNNVPYINLAKAKIKEILANDGAGAVIPAETPNKATLLQQLNVFIDTLNSNAALGLAQNVAAPGNDNAHLVSARKAAIDVAMVQKVNAKMDELVGVGAQPIKDALMAVFAGR